MWFINVNRITRRVGEEGRRRGEGERRKEEGGRKRGKKGGRLLMNRGDQVSES